MRLMHLKTNEFYDTEEFTWGTGLFDTQGDEAFVGDLAVDQYDKEFTVTYGQCQANPNAFSTFIPCVHAVYSTSGEKYQIPSRFTVKNKLFGGALEKAKSNVNG